MRDLYLPEKYKVWQGVGSIGFCTVWSDPELVLQTAPRVLDKVGILGTLYSREGVNVVLRNLALNTDIKQLFLWGNGALSKTPFGLAGMEIIKALWKNGFDSNHQISGNTFKLHPEFNLDVIAQILKNVELVDVSQENLKTAIEKIPHGRISKNYMKSVKFPEHKLEAGREFPSEKVGFVCRGQKIADVWTKVVDKIMRYGIIKETEYGNKQRELINVNWVVENENTLKPHFPSWPEELTKVNGANKKSLEKYYPEFMTSRLPAGTAYTYGQRLWKYANKYNQIEKIIEHLKESPVTRRAVATTWDQFLDSDKKTKNPPCLVSIQAIQTEGKLHFLAVFRSHDIFKAAIPNAFGLRRLQEHIAKATGFDVGYLSITSASAHIYEEDWDNAAKLLQCALWSRNASGFNEKNDIDPRGVILIRLEGKKIRAEINELVFTGKTAIEVYLKISRLDLLSRSDHYMDIGAELQKAEIARDLGIEYRQDKALKLKK